MGVPILLAFALLSAPSGESFARAGETALVRVELRSTPGVLFNHRGPSRLQLESPFGPVLERRVARGTPLRSDPRNYDIAVPALIFEIQVPAGARPGDHSLRLSAELYLCDSVKHACFRARQTAQVTLHVGAAGTNGAVVLEARAGKGGD